MKFIYQVSQLLKTNDFKSVDDLFLEIDPLDKLKTIALLRMTLPVKDLLKNRKIFILFLDYYRVKEKTSYDKLLTGLKDD